MEVFNLTFEEVSLEQEIHKLEESLIMQALQAADGCLLEAARYLQLRSEGALKFILRRHPNLRPYVQATAQRTTDQERDRKAELIVVSRVQ